MAVSIMRTQCLVLAADVQYAVVAPSALPAIRMPSISRCGIVLEDLPVLERPRLALVAVDAQVLRLVVPLRHETPFQACGKGGAAAAAEVRRLDDADDLVGSHRHRTPGLLIAATGFVDIDAMQVGDIRQQHWGYSRSSSVLLRRLLEVVDQRVDLLRRELLVILLVDRDHRCGAAGSETFGFVHGEQLSPWFRRCRCRSLSFRFSAPCRIRRAARHVCTHLQLVFARLDADGTFRRR
jgi:hypothetical protein